MNITIYTDLSYENATYCLKNQNFTGVNENYICVQFPYKNHQLQVILHKINSLYIYHDNYITIICFQITKRTDIKVKKSNKLTRINA